MNRKKPFLFLCASAFMFIQNATAQYSWDRLPTAEVPVFKKDTVRITSYGAKADGITLNTKAINDAITACSSKGGGVVLIPAGLWLTGPVVMKSKVNLHLQASAILQFTSDFNAYPLVEGNWEGKNQARNQSPISGDNLESIAITGKGIIDGNGDVWCMVGKDRLTDNQWKKKVASGGLVSADGKLWYPSEKTKKAHEEKLSGVIENGKTLKDFEAIKDYLRPNLLVLSNCKKVLLDGVIFQNSPAWCLHPLLCEDLTIRNVTVKNPEYAQNGDGVDIESCRNVLIEGSTFDVGDDGICIKSGRDEEGRKRGKPTENVVIRNNIVYKAHGGFVIGSEMSGGAKNIFVYDCAFMGTDKGLRFKTARGRGGIVENIYCRNIQMENIVQEAIYFDMYYFTKPPKPGEKAEAPPVSEATPQFRNFYIDNIVCLGADKAVFIRGLPEMKVKNIHLSNLTLQADKPIEIIEAENISLQQVKVIAVKTTPVVYVENSRKIYIDELDYGAKADVLVTASGSNTGEVQISNTDSKKAATATSLVNGAVNTAVEIKNR